MVELASSLTPGPEISAVSTEVGSVLLTSACFATSRSSCTAYIHAWVTPSGDTELLSAGRALLGACSEWAFTDPAVEVLRVRAHEYEKEAQKLYKKLGFKPKESVVTYALELE